MQISIDPYEVLSSVSSNPDAFIDIKADIEKSARTLVEKTLKSTKLNQEKLISVRDALGDDILALTLDSFPLRALKTIGKRLDRHHDCFQKGADEPSEKWLRSHLLDLASGQVDLSPKPEKASPPRKKTASPAKKTKKASATTRTPAKIGERTAVHTKRRRKSA